MKSGVCRGILPLLIVSFVLLTLHITAIAQDELIWAQAHGTGPSSVKDYGPAQKSGSPEYNYNAEYVDDIDLVGTINRIDFLGYVNGPSLPSPTSEHYHGVNIRFYAVGQDNKPAALQAEYFVAKNSPDMLYQGTAFGDMRVRLATPFKASGRHFISVQLVLDPIFIPGGGGALAHWYWRSGNVEAIRGEAPYNRAAPTDPWDRTGFNDGQRNLSMRLYGTRSLVTPAVLTQLSRNTLTHSGRLKISGSNFGNEQGTSVVRINGAVAPVSSWSETSITAYATDAAMLGEGNVQVTTEGGGSNTLPITVTARPLAQGRIKWRFQVDAGQIWGKPAAGPDGSVYAVDQRGNLYGLTIDGALKWIFKRDGSAMQGVSVSVDGTIYYAAGNDLYAVNPDGTLKWSIEGARGGVLAGPEVGPDGNVYAVFENTQATGQSAITVNANGEVINNVPGYGPAFGPREIVFGAPGQFYFNLNNIDSQKRGLNFFELGGDFLFAKNQFSGQPAVGPDGTIYTVQSSTSQLAAIDPASGNIIRTFGNLTAPDVDDDGNIYAATNSSKVFSYEPTGEERWQFQSFGFLGDPMVSPDNNVAVIDTYKIGAPSTIHGLDTEDGGLKWRVDLPAENGGYVRTYSRQSFSGDSSTVYFGMNVNDYAADVYSYVYAITSADLPCTFVVSPTVATSAYNGGTGHVQLTPTNADCKWTASTENNWIALHSESGTGNAVICYTVLANPNQTPRTGSITIAGQTVTITQDPKPNDTEVNITYPEPGQEFTAPASVFVAANAIAPGGTISRVEFYINGNNRLGIDETAPYQLVWNDVDPGNYTFTAKAFDDEGVEILSQPVPFKVHPVPGPEPIPLPISDPELLQPEDGDIFNAGDNIQLEARPRSSFYPVARVEFYLGTTLVGEDDTSPYTYELQNAPAGPQTISARTIAVTGAMANCRPIDIVVNPLRESAGRTRFDFDGDSRADISIYRNGQWHLNRSSDGYAVTNFGLPTDQLAPADYDGDGTTDIAVFRNGAWYVLGSRVGLQVFNFGLAGDIPQPGDHNGDGRDDLMIFRPNGGLWYAAMSDGTFAAYQFGLAGDKPVAADYDGDGKIDIAVFRDGVWYILKTSGGFVISQFGSTGDRPVQADYDGDNKADIAVYRNGIWYILGSNDGVKIYNFGLGEDSPTPADYDGDGRDDIGVFRASTGGWYVIRSQAGMMIDAFGLQGDRAVPSAYVR